jgi:hypothetical protein
MSTQHTPGPWSVDLGTATATVRSEHKGVSIARCYQGDEDARLIAAAPELLEALQDMLRCQEMISKGNHEYLLPWGSVRAAIAKATT